MSAAGRRMNREDCSFMKTPAFAKVSERPEPNTASTEKHLAWRGRPSRREIPSRLVRARARWRHCAGSDGCEFQLEQDAIGFSSAQRRTAGEDLPPLVKSALLPPARLRC